MHSKTSLIIAATFAALAVLLIAAFGISAQTAPLSATTTAAATGNRDDSEEAANTLTSAQTITLTAHNIRGQWSWTIETGGQTVATVTGERRAGGVQYTMSTTSGNTISSTTGTASTATSAHIYNWDNQETGTITSELTPATTFHTHANGYTGTDPTDGTITVTSGFPTKAVIINASLEQKCVLSQEYKNTPAWESVYTLTCDTNIGEPPDGVTAVWLSIYTINATR